VKIRKFLVFYEVEFNLLFYRMQPLVRSRVSYYDS